MTGHSFGLIAARSVDAEALADAVPGLPREAIGAAGPWSWLRFDPGDPTAVGGSDGPAVRASDALGAVVLVVRVDGEGSWTLGLFVPGRPPLRTAWHPSLLALAGDRSTPKTGEPFAAIVARLDADVPEGYRMPAEILRRVEGRSRQSLTAALKAMAREVDQALVRAGITGQDWGIRKLLIAADRRKTRGLPSSLAGLLDALGLGKAGVEPDDRWCVGGQADSVGSFDRRRPMTDVAPAALEIAGVPVDLPADDLGRIWLLSWFCDTDAEADFLVTLPPGGRLSLPALEHWVNVHRRGDRLYVEVAWNPPGPRFKAYKALGDAIASAPDGTTVEILCGDASGDDDEDDDDDPPLRTGNQRYRGVLSGGRWRVSEAFPRLTAADLERAMAFCRTIDQIEIPYALASEAEAREVASKARRSGWFSADDEPAFEVDGAGIRCEDRHSRLPLALFVFRRAFADGPWDVLGGEARDDEIDSEWDEAIDGVTQMAEAFLAAPATDEVILETERAVFRRADWSELGSSIFGEIAEAIRLAMGEDGPDSQTPLERLAVVDQSLLARGFERLGDLHCNRFVDLYLRGYVAADGLTYACAIAGTSGQFETDLVTRLADGTALTTSTTAGLKSRKKERIVKQSFPGATIETLLVEHGAAIARLSSRSGNAVAVEPTLVGFCRALDDYIARELDREDR